MMNRTMGAKSGLTEKMLLVRRAKTFRYRLNPSHTVISNITAITITSKKLNIRMNKWRVRLKTSLAEFSPESAQGADDGHQ